MQLYCPSGISPIGNAGCLPRESKLQQSCATQSMSYAGCFSIFIVHWTLTWTTGSYNMCTDADARLCTRVCTDTVRESALKVDSWRKIPCRIEELNRCQRHAGPALYQLSYIPLLTLTDDICRGGEHRSQQWVLRQVHHPLPPCYHFQVHVGHPQTPDELHTGSRVSVLCVLPLYHLQTPAQPHTEGRVCVLCVLPLYHLQTPA